MHCMHAKVRTIGGAQHLGASSPGAERLRFEALGVVQDETPLPPQGPVVRSPDVQPCHVMIRLHAMK